MVEDKRTLSEYLLDHISDGSRFPSLLEVPSDEKAMELCDGVAALVRAFLDSKESFSGTDWSILEPRLMALVSDFGSDLRRQCAWELTTSLLARVPGLVDRTLKLSELIGQGQPTKQVEDLLREATRCYVFGFWQAAAALARAAVEDALRDRVHKQFGRAPVRFGDLINFCRTSGLLDGVHYSMANVVKVNGDTALHGGKTDPSDARDALVNARGILEFLHR